jgi:hypothetical protein
MYRKRILYKFYGGPFFSKIKILLWNLNPHRDDVIPKGKEASTKDSGIFLFCGKTVSHRDTDFWPLFIFSQKFLNASR